MLKSKLVREMLKAKSYGLEEVEKGRTAVEQDLMSSKNWPTISPWTQMRRIMKQKSQ